MLSECIYTSEGGSQIAKEEFVDAAPSSADFNIGFKPKIVVLSFMYNNNAVLTQWYDEDYSTTKFQRYYNGTLADTNLKDNSVTGLYEITNTGFKLNSSYLSYVRKYSYVAIG